MDIQFIFNSINKNKNIPTQDDKTFRISTKEQISVRDKQYTDLLSHFVLVTCLRNWVKEIFKWGFMLTIVCCTIAFSRCIFSLFKRYLEVDIKEIINSIPLLMTSIIGFVSAIIGIPTIVIKYLFSTDEDKYITDIILHTQKHDTSGRKWATDNDINTNEDNSQFESLDTENTQAS